MKWRSIGKRWPKGSPPWLWKWTADGRWAGKERKLKAQKLAGTAPSGKE